MNPVTHTLSSANNWLVEHRRNYYITYNNIPVELLNIFFKDPKAFKKYTKFPHQAKQG